MKITPKQYAALLYEMTSEAKGTTLAEHVRKFVQVLAKNRAFALLPRIERAYVHYYNAQEDVLDVTVTSARELSHHALKLLKAALKDANVECVTQIDPAVLGGARIQVGDYMIDDTLKARLQMLKHKLVSS